MVIKYRQICHHKPPLIPLKDDKKSLFHPTQEHHQGKEEVSEAEANGVAGRGEPARELDQTHPELAQATAYPETGKCVSLISMFTLYVYSVL